MPAYQVCLVSEDIPSVTYLGASVSSRSCMRNCIGRCSGRSSGRCRNAGCLYRTGHTGRNSIRRCPCRIFIGVPLAMLALNSYGLDPASAKGIAMATSFGAMVGTLGTVLFYGTKTINLVWQHMGMESCRKRRI